MGTKAEDKQIRRSQVMAMKPEVIGDGGFGWGFFADRGVRETIESIVVAVLLALLFRGFEGEAFMIPTGSMAPGLQGHHIDLACPKCGAPYRSGAAGENNLVPAELKEPVVATCCPICGWANELNPARDRDHVSNQGDRILVNKYIYDFREPERFDVIVFKNPNNGKQNLIKRLVGLPGEYLTISRGDIYRSDARGANREIVRKPADKQLAMLQMVDDTAYRARDLEAAGWPEKWQSVGDPADFSSELKGNRVSFQADATDASAPKWLRYRHLRPIRQERVNLDRLPARVRDFKGQLIGDYYCYNDVRVNRLRRVPPDFRIWRDPLTGQVERILDDPYSFASPANPYTLASPANHWVGDLAIETTIRSTSGTGTVLLDLVEAGAHFQCEFNLADGQATISCQHPEVRFEGATAGSEGNTQVVATPVRGTGEFVVTFCNADDRLFLWVNQREIGLPRPAYQRPGRIYPFWSEQDPGDAAPLGIGVKGTKIEISRLRVLRDVYYVSEIGNNTGEIRNETGMNETLIRRIHGDPQLWDSPEGRALFDASYRDGNPMFPIPEDCYFPLGDNSPESKDARIWESPHFFVRDLLIGRAMVVYWPHPKNKPIPYMPNFGQMRPIR